MKRTPENRIRFPQCLHFISLFLSVESKPLPLEPSVSLSGKRPSIFHIGQISRTPFPGKYKSFTDADGFFSAIGVHRFRANNGITLRGTLEKGKPVFH
jgi:hypothetical protein